MCSPRLLSQVYKSIEREDRKVSRRSIFAALGATALGATAIAGGTASAAPAALPSGGSTLVDLTHVLTTDFPVWPGAPSFEMKNLARIASTGGSLGSLGSLGSGSSFYLNELRMGEHTGTHIDAPAHASADGITVEKIPVADLVVPIAVIDISVRAEADNNTVLTRADILDWETVHGMLPSRSLIAMNSGWDARLRVDGAFTNQDALGRQHTPGFDPDAVDFLVRERDIVALGSDTLSIDAGRSTTYGAHRNALGSGKYAVEALANLSTLPPVGATVMIGAPTHAGGSGGPCRVIAWH